MNTLLFVYLEKIIVFAKNEKINCGGAANFITMT
jgi:hypothetical protein